MKICKTCDEEFPLSGFPINATGADRHRNDCKACHSKKTKEWNATPERVDFLKGYNTTPERKKGKVKNVQLYRERNPFHDIASNAYVRQQRRGHPEWAKPLMVDIEKCWIKCAGKCELCFTPIELGQGSCAPNAATLDAINPAEPYITGNIAFLCAPCNTQKSNHTLETAQRLVEFLMENSHGIPRTVY